MASPKTQKPATARHGEPVSKIDRFAGEIDTNITHIDLQAQRLSRRFGFALETCVVIASLAWGIAR